MTGAFIAIALTLLLSPKCSLGDTPDKDAEVAQLRYLFEKGISPSVEQLRLGYSWNCKTHWSSPGHFGSSTFHGYFKFAQDPHSSKILNMNGIHAKVFQFKSNDLYGNHLDGNEIFGTDVIRVNHLDLSELVVEFVGPKASFFPLYVGVWLGLYGLDPISPVGIGSTTVGYRICR